jgi:hypothetical protein
MTIREDILQTIQDHISTTQLDEMILNQGLSERLQTTLNEATLEQLWSMYKLLIKGTKFKLLPSVAKDHIGITFANMYVGIEPDGYTHS